MPINYRPTFSAAADWGAQGTGTKELGYAGLSTNVESQLSLPADVHQAHTYFQPPLDGRLAGLPAVAPGIGHSALVMPPGQEPISPIIQMIMKMPGHLGLANSFFEWLGHMFLPAHDLLANIDLSGLGLHAHETISSLTTAAGDHLPIDPSLLPAEAPILQGGMNHIAEHCSSNPLQVSATLDPAKPQFETGSCLGQAAGGRSELISGPSLSDNTAATHLAGGQRLFSDKLSSTPINPIISQSSLPPTLPAPSNGLLNVSASPFGPQLGAAPVSPTVEPKTFGPSGAVTNWLSDKPLVASGEVPSTFSQSSQLSEAQAATSALPGLKAQELCLPGVKNINSSLTPIKPLHPSPASADGSLLKATTPAAGKEIVHPHTNQELASNPDTGHKPPHPLSLKHKEAGGHLKPVKAASKTSSPSPSSSPDSKLSDAHSPTGPSSSEQTSTYTVRSGDCLWSIAKEHLGSGLHWQDLYKLNHDMLGSNPSMIHTGATIQLPGTMDGAQIADTIGSHAASYVVKPGDSLWSIAQDHLGQPNKWGELFQANSSVIGSNPNLIHPGQELTMPGAPTQLASSVPASAAPHAVASHAVAPPAVASHVVAPHAVASHVVAPHASAPPVTPRGSLNAGLASSSTVQSAPHLPAAQPASPVFSSLRSDLSFLLKHGIKAR